MSASEFAQSIAICEISIPGRSISELNAADGTQVVLQLRLKVPTKELRIESYSGSGEMAMFVHYRKLRKSRNAQWNSKQSGTNQLVKLKEPKLGRYFVVLEPKNNSNFSGVKIKVDSPSSWLLVSCYLNSNLRYKTAFPTFIFLFSFYFLLFIFLLH